MRTRRFPTVAAALATALLLSARATPAQAAPTPRGSLPVWLVEGFSHLSFLWKGGVVTPAGRQDVPPPSLARKGCAIDPNGLMICAPEAPTPPPG
jgi:hypothetical protein